MKRLFSALSGAAALLAVTGMLVGCAKPDEAVTSSDLENPPLLTNETSVVYDVEPDYIFTYAENQTEDYPTTQGAYRFAQLVNERTKGRIQIRVYANSELGDEQSTIAQLRFGGIDFVRCSMSTMSPYSDMTNLLMLPYLYRDADHMWRVLEGDIGRQVAESFMDEGIVPLAWYDAGVRSFYFKTPVSTKEEIAGLVIRVQPNEMMEDMVELLGASALPVEYKNVYSAIQQGEADGAENNWSSYEAMQHDKVAPYYLLDEHMRVPEMQMISGVTWGILPEEDRAIIRQCAAQSADYERMLWKTREDEARLRVLSQGSSEITLSAEEKMKFRDAMEPLYVKYCGEYMDLVDEIRKMGDTGDE